MGGKVAIIYINSKVNSSRFSEKFNRRSKLAFMTSYLIECLICSLLLASLLSISSDFLV